MNEKMNQFFNACWEEFLTFPQLRTGQNMFNALYRLFPDVANEIRGTEYDCFYGNNAGEFLDKVEELLT
jgi:hypothetical protein